MDRGTIGGGVLAAGGVLVGSFGPAAFPSLVLPASLLGLALVIVGLCLVLTKGKRPVSDEDSSEKPAAIHMEHTRNSDLSNIHIAGHETGIRDIHGENNSYRNIRIDRPESPPKPKRRTLFAGFSFTKGDHLKKE